MERKKYDTAYKLEVIRMVNEDGLNGMEVSRKLGIHEKTVYRWLSEYRKDGQEAFPGKGHLKPADEELRQLRRQVRDLQEENEILKKAAAIFAKQEK
jgi:Transposase and inactivated derivatives